MDGKIIGGIVAVIVVAGLGWYLLSSNPATTPTTTTNVTQTETSSSTPATTGTPANAVTITYTNSGFSPKSLTIAEGTTVNFVNKSSNDMWVASDPHPTHQGYDGTSRTQHCVAGYTGAAPFDECAMAQSGGTFSFTFTKVGTWGYHNHAVDEDRGTIIVTPAAAASASATVNI